VAERGRHGALLASGGLYARMWVSQAAEQDLEPIEAARHEPAVAG
jgi:hypothetical protein